jgi:hypothetical protein
VERNNLVCVLIGRFTTIYPNITGEDLRITIDQHLIKCNQLPLSLEENGLLQSLIDETVISVLGMGVNRKERRNTK